MRPYKPAIFTACKICGNPQDAAVHLPDYDRTREHWDHAFEPKLMTRAEAKELQGKFVFTRSEGGKR